jgi:hypothetical protein
MPNHRWTKINEFSGDMSKIVSIYQYNNYELYFSAYNDKSETSFLSLFFHVKMRSIDVMLNICIILTNILGIAHQKKVL